jgi:hypothetical protein
VADEAVLNIVRKKIPPKILKKKKIIKGRLSGEDLWRVGGWTAAGLVPVFYSRLK